jgi:hypothetical protein
MSALNGFSSSLREIKLSKNKENVEKNSEFKISPHRIDERRDEIEKKF